MLDIIIRDASNNKQSLDDVMRSEYRATYKAGKGFTGTDWWGAVSKAAGGKSFTEFTRFVDGREPFPWDSILPLAGLRLGPTRPKPRLGVNTEPDSASGASRVTQIPGSAAEEAGLQPGTSSSRSAISRSPPTTSGPTTGRCTPTKTASRFPSW